MLAIQILTYVCVLLFLGFIVGRVVKYAKTPLHLRWELYPVAHEKGRAAYGGSIFEELEWWTKPRQVDRIGELAEMLREIVFLKGVFRHNRPLWYFSYPFHLGLYLLVGWLGLLFMASLLFVFGIALGGGWFGYLVRYLVAICGYGGLGLTAIGSLGLLARRLGNRDIRRYSAPVEYINLVFILATVVTALVVHISYDPWFGAPAAYMVSLISFSSFDVGSQLPAGILVELVLGSLLLAYIPMTRMAHFVSKYFLYHDVRWSDEPNQRGSKIEFQIKGNFAYRMNWQGPHIQSGKSWAEVGTSDMPKADDSGGEKAKEVQA
ncbi:MAG TPA: respiratory nitrate reductase subunit gamma [Myxococcota bacterium]|nr:respiratory nitrate reductase subunit gamma [Myxococcota bacterium]